jgi:ribulose-phosphate 3-epimerase
MEIIPVLNAVDEETLLKRRDIASSFLNGKNTVHVDVADGSFTEGYKTWVTPENFSQVFTSFLPKISLHIMSSEIEKILSEWLAVNPARVIVHFDSISDISGILSICKNKNAPVYLAMTPKTKMTDFLKAVAGFDGCLVLAVAPGKSGQEFSPASLVQIKEIREHFPSLPICVDGGVNLEVVKACKNAGATELAVGAHIFNDANPEKIYKEFVEEAGG